MVAIVTNRCGPSVHRNRFVAPCRPKRRCVPIQEVDEAATGDDVSDGVDEVDETQTAFPSLKTLTSTRHIHPCICDLSRSAKKRINEYRMERKDFYQRYERRVNEIEELARRMEELRLEAERTATEHKELYGDEYEMIAGKKKRKKRSARRASMVSLGVRTIIKWKKEPRIPIKYTRAWTLRQGNTAYCGQKTFPLPIVVDMNYKKCPLIPVRGTHTCILRSNTNIMRRYQAEVDAFDPHPMFITSYRNIFD